MQDTGIVSGGQEFARVDSVFDERLYYLLPFDKQLTLAVWDSSSADCRSLFAKKEFRVKAVDRPDFRREQVTEIAVQEQGSLNRAG